MAWNLFSAALFVSSVMTTAVEPRVDIFTERAAIVARYCWIETGAHFEDCAAPRDISLAVIYLPFEQGQKLAEAINASIARGYTNELSGTDLFHAHMILKGPQTQYESPVEFLQDLQMSLFHSAESTRRWYQEGLRGRSINERTPRSFVSGPAGGLQKAIDLIPQGVRLKKYEDAGTIFSEELAEALPGLTFHKLSGYSGYETLRIKVNAMNCVAHPVIYIFQEPGGRFQTSDGKTFELFFHCIFKPDPVTIAR